LENPKIVREMLRRILKIEKENERLQKKYFEPSDLNKTTFISDEEMLKRLKALGYIK